MTLHTTTNIFYGNKVTIVTISQYILTYPFTKMSSYTERPLFGGAISCEIPTAWRDVSDIRQVPDHQECWQDIEGAVLVVEILQRQHVSDSEAAKFFFEDLAESNGSTSNQFVARSALPTTTTVGVGCAGSGFQTVAVGRNYDIAGNLRTIQEIHLIRVELCVFRLERLDTDLLVTLSKPAVSNPNEPPQDLQQPWSDTFQKVISTLQIRDWGLFD